MSATLPRSPHQLDPAILGAAATWGAGRWAACLLDVDGVVAEGGAVQAVLPWASVTKLLTAYTALVAVERGLVGLDDPAGPPGATVRHLLAHAAGLAFDDPTVVSPPARTRIYSNAGFDALAGVIERTARRPFGAILRTWVLDPLGMDDARLVGRPSEGMTGSVRDLSAFALELLRPRLLAPTTLSLATEVAFPGLRGILPGIGRMDPLDWGLGFELRDGKDPHWTGTRCSPRTFGHFGGSGTFLWVDPDARLALAVLTDRPFGPWALDAWPALSDALLDAAGGGA